MNLADLRGLCEQHHLSVVGTTYSESAGPGLIVDAGEDIDRLAGLPSSVNVIACGPTLALVRATECAVAEDATRQQSRRAGAAPT